MRNFLCYLLLVILAAGWLRDGANMRRERRRMEENQLALSDSIHYYRSAYDKEVASVLALRLRCSEFEVLRRADLDEIRSLGIRLKRAESAAKSVVQSVVEVKTTLHDTVWMRDTVRLFRWRDSWVDVRGRIEGDSLSCEVETVDTLVQIVHRVPRRFLFFKWGTKALRQEIISKNPHSKIVFSEYVKIESK